MRVLANKKHTSKVLEQRRASGRCAARDLVQILAAACRRASKAVEELYDPFPLQPVGAGPREELHAIEKDSRDPRTVVSKADLLSEKIIISTLRNELQCTFLSEEAGVIRPPRETEYRVVVDSLDGSKNFLQGSLGLYGISVAIERRGQLVAGAIALPYFDELLIGERGSGTCLHRLHGTDGPTRIPKARDSGLSLSKARVCLGRGAAPADVINLPPLSRIQGAANEAINYASCTIGLASVILGRVDALVLPGQRYWDFAAGLLILKELEGRFGIWEGGWNIAVKEQDLASATASSLYDVVATRDQKLFDDILAYIAKPA